jgi:addiction module HigA family antidote
MALPNQYHPQSRPHPGESLAEKLDEMEMGVNEFALRTCKPEKTIIAVLKGKSSITPDMAVAFERVTSIPVSFWLNHQQVYDEFIARNKYKTVITAAIPWAKRFPLAEMIRLGWLPKERTIEEKTVSLLQFFGLAKHEAWDEYYCKQNLQTAFRITLTHTKDPHAISAWLRRGELQANALYAEPYNEGKFKEALREIRTLMVRHPDECFETLQQICCEAGVKVVRTPCIKRAPINGATRWIGDAPLIQISGHFKRNDVFWFTFFHEAGHILLHGKKGIFLEDVNFVARDEVKEQEANAFAIRYTRLA